MKALERVQSIVLAVHRRNGGGLDRVDPESALLDGSLLLDSLDLAEIVAAIEKEFGVSPFDAAEPPRTWGRLIERLEPQTTPNSSKPARGALGSPQEESQ